MAKASARKLRNVKPSETKNIAISPSLTEQIYRGRHAPPVHFVSPAMCCRSSRSEHGCVAFDLAAVACLRPGYRRSAGAEETAPRGAWRGLCARIQHAQYVRPA